MTDEADFAAALSALLGPLYQVSVVDAAGAVTASFRAARGDAVHAARISLPGSTAAVLVEVDVAALQRADLVLHDLARAPGEPSIGRRTLDHALDELVAAGEAAVGRPIAEMSRVEKQRLVKFLDERGAFSLRKSVETVADALGVSRFTVYNYLDASRGS